MFAGIAVFEGNQTINISHEFPCFLGYSPNKHLPQGRRRPAGRRRRAVVPGDVQHKDKSFWAHIDVDTLKAASPMWTFPGNMRMQGDSGVILGQLLEELKKKATPQFKEAAKKRVEALTAERKAWREGARQDGRQQGQARTRSIRTICHGRAQQAAEARRHRDATKASATPARCCCSSSGRMPNTCVRSGGGGLGWSGGMALGAKLAAPGQAGGAGGRRRRLLFRRADVRCSRWRSTTSCRSWCCCSTTPAGRR